MLQERRSAPEALLRAGLRVICARCAKEQRHFQERQGRLRERRCSCGGRMRARWWILEHPDRWAQLVKEERSIMAPFGY